LAADNSSKSQTLLKEYVLEAQRLTSSQRNLRIAKVNTTIDGQTINRGDAVLCLLVRSIPALDRISSNTKRQGEAGRDPNVVEDPLEFKLGRKAQAITHFSMGPHECIGRQIAITFVTGLVKLAAGLKDLRPAPGSMGLMKAIQVGTEKCYLNDSWSHLTFDPTSKSCLNLVIILSFYLLLIAWKMHFDGFESRVYK
jgi:hypothetical protein